jgi:hypothetical protein
MADDRVFSPPAIFAGEAARLKGHAPQGAFTGIALGNGAAEKMVEQTFLSASNGE